MARNLLISAQTENIEAIYVAVDQNGTRQFNSYRIFQSSPGVYGFTVAPPVTRLAGGDGSATYFIYEGGLHVITPDFCHYLGDFTSGTPIVIHYEVWSADYTLYPVSDGEFTFYVSKDGEDGDYTYMQWYSPEDTGDGWEPGRAVAQLHVKKYGRDGKVLSSVFPGVSYDGESVTYNPTREPYSVGYYSGEIWVERFSAYTEYLLAGNAYGADVTSLDSPSAEDWYFINGVGVINIPKGTKKVIIAYPDPEAGPIK